MRLRGGERGFQMGGKKRGLSPADMVEGVVVLPELEWTVDESGREWERIGVEASETEGGNEG